MTLIPITVRELKKFLDTLPEDTPIGYRDDEFNQQIPLWELPKICQAEQSFLSQTGYFGDVLIFNE